MELTKIRRERAVDAVYEALRQAIVSSLMKPGERLNVEEVSQKLGVSLTPVRSAIQQLATEGLVEIQPRSGTFGASLSVQDVERNLRNPLRAGVPGRREGRREYPPPGV